MTDGRQVEPRPVPEALTDTFAPEPFNGVEAGRDWVSLAEKIGQAKLEELMAIFGAYPMDPSQ